MKSWCQALEKLRRGLALGFGLSLVVGCSFAEPAMKENLLTVRINGKDIAENEPVIEWEPGRFYISAGVFYRARLPLPPVRPTHIAAYGDNYYPVDAIPGASYKLDAAMQQLDISVPLGDGRGTFLDALGNIRTAATRPEPGLFLNHDFQLLQSYGQRSLSGLMEGGLFSRYGVFTTQFAGANLTSHIRPIRLNSQFMRDFPERMTTLTIGDAVSAISPWSRTTYYAGVRYASKFATQPGFIPVVLPGLTGQAAQPSTVDIYVDNVKRLSRPIDAGPFSINNIPTLSDQGQIRMVVTDILGRQQVITESYIRSSQLLRPGVSEFTYEAGSPRYNFGVSNFDYRSFFAASTYRRGFGRGLTMEGRLEATPRSATGGLGGVYAIPRVAILGAGMAASGAEGFSSGILYYAQLSRQQRGFGLAAQLQKADRDFRQVGLQDWQLASRTLLQAQVSRSLGHHGVVSGGYLKRDGRTELSAQAVTASVGLRIGRSYLTVNATYSLLDSRQKTLNVSFVRTLGERTTAIAGGLATPDARTATMEVNRSIPLGPGYGYRVRSTNLDQQGNDAGLYYQNSDGFYGVEMNQRGSGQSWRFIERGSIVLMHRHLMTSRWLNDSFGVVEVPGEKGIPVYVNHQLAAKTNRQGFALLPWMVPYNLNTVNLDESTLPSDISLDLEERTVVPMARSGVYLMYQRAVEGGATLILHTADGADVPNGASVTLNGQPEEYTVVLRGEVFVTNISYPARIHAEWDKHSCVAKIEHAPADAVVPKIGPLVCAGER
ncbi:MAG: fimbria/pilus outer membrane usher protein [Bryobacteraceae bacterium]